MSTRNQYPGIDPYVVRLVRHCARMCCRTAHLGSSDVPDVEQELFLDLYRRMAKYEPERASFRTFANRVVRNRAHSLLESTHAGIRNGRTVSLDDHPNGDDGPTREESLLDAGLLDAPDVGRADRDLDVRRALERLPGALKPLSETLCHYTPTETAARLGMSRSAVYWRRELVRRELEKLDLFEYLNLQNDDASGK